MSKGKKSIDLYKMTPSQMANMLAFSPSTARSLMNEGKLDHWKIPNGGDQERQHKLSSVDNAIRFCEKNSYPMCFVEGYVDRHFGHEKWVEVMNRFNNNRPPAGTLPAGDTSG